MSLADRDAAVLWHPYTQMQLEPYAVPIVRGEGAYLIAEDGTRYLDAISSWWVNIHGHAEPTIAARVSEQLHQLEQVIFAGFTHAPAVELAERLCGIIPGGPAKIFLSDNGSTAVEVALKMAVQFWANRGEERTRFIAIDGCYHGDTFGAMSLAAGEYCEPFRRLLFPVSKIPFPTAENEQQVLDAFEREASRHDAAAFIYEPLLLAAGGMRVYSPSCLNELLRIAKSRGLLCIADEVMTGFMRLGVMFAGELLKLPPDIVCLSKAITGGFMALGATSATAEIYSAFLSTERRRMLLHGHSFSGNPLACAAACASLDLLQSPACVDRVRNICRRNLEFLSVLREYPGRAANPRCAGTMLAFEVPDRGGNAGYYSLLREKLYPWFLERKILLRPLGNVLYALPPYCISESELAQVHQLMLEGADYAAGSS